MNNSSPQHNDSIIAGIDIGGTHITVALVDTVKKEILPHTIQRKKIDSSSDANTIINEWSDNISASYRQALIKPYRLGIAIPGPFDYVQGISLIHEQKKFNSLYGLNIKNILAKKLNLYPDNIVFNNDAACFLQGELYNGSAKEFDCGLGLTLGSGLGSASFENDQAIDADLWHHPFKNGIVEDHLSSRWILKRYTELSGNKIDDVKALADSITSSGNHQAKLVFEEFGENLAGFLNPFLSPGKIQVVVLGGNISKAYSLFFPKMTASLNPENQRIKIVPSHLGEDAALLGAASFCFNFCNASRV